MGFPYYLALADSYLQANRCYRAKTVIPSLVRANTWQLEDGLKWLKTELLDEVLPERVKRYCPRAVKKQRSKYPPKKMKPKAESRKKTRDVSNPISLVL